MKSTIHTTREPEQVPIGMVMVRSDKDNQLVERPMICALIFIFSKNF